MESKVSKFHKHTKSRRINGPCFNTYRRSISESNYKEINKSFQIVSRVLIREKKISLMV